MEAELEESPEKTLKKDASVASYIIEAQRVQEQQPMVPRPSESTLQKQRDSPEFLSIQIGSKRVEKQVKRIKEQIVADMGNKLKGAMAH